MGVIWTPQTRTQQPTGPSSFAVRNDVVFAWNARYHKKTNLASSLVTSGHESFKQTSSGFGMDMTSASNVAYNSIAVSSPGTSFVAVVRFTNLSTNSTGILLAGKTYYTNGNGFMFESNSDENTLEINGGDSGSFPKMSVPGLGTIGKTNTIAVCYAGTSVSVALNGKYIGAVTLGTAAGTWPSGIGIGNYAGTSTGSNDTSRIYYMAAVVRGGPEQLISLSANPWQVFAPDIRPKLFYVAGGGGSTVTGAGSSAGVGTVSGAGASTSAQVGSSAGTGTASGVGRSTANSVGSSTGTGTASGVGSSTGGSDGVGSSTGTGTATGVGASTAASLGSTAGVGAASGIGASTAASVGSASGTGTASGVGTNGSIVSTGVGSSSGTGTATGISPTVSRGGGKTTGSNLSRKQKKKLKAVESQEWLKAEETARQLLSDRFTKQTPQEKAQALETHIESLTPVIEALKAITDQIEDVQETVQETKTEELTEHKQILNKFDALITKMTSIEELLIIMLAQ